MREGFDGNYSLGKETTDPINDREVRNCDQANCKRQAEYRAPKSRKNLREYYWFCLEHIRLYNSSWNYYKGMTGVEIESERHADAYWHRPTSPLGGNNRHRLNIKDNYGIFDKEKENNKRKSDFFKLTAPELSALSILELSPPVSIQELKDKYKELVKLYHPDTNGGSKSAEEKLKSINRAYETLIRLTNS